MVDGELALRDCLETTSKELEICKEHFKTKVKECDALEIQVSEYDRGKLDLETQIYQLKKLND